MGFADPFYQSMAWVNCREAYKRKAGGLCERCYERGYVTPGTDVHHIKPLTQQNINDPSVSLADRNLMLLCSRCHHEVHANMKRKKTNEQKRFSVLPDGSIKILEPPHFSKKFCE